MHTREHWEEALECGQRSVTIAHLTGLVPPVPPDVLRRYDEVVVKLSSQVKAQRGLVPSTAYSCFGVPGWATCGGVPMSRLCCRTLPPLPFESMFACAGISQRMLP